MTNDYYVTEETAATLVDVVAHALTPEERTFFYGICVSTIEVILFARDLETREFFRLATPSEN